MSQLRSANENLVLATIKAQMMQEKAEAAHQRQNEFLAMLAHELRNPLAPLSNATTVLERLTSADPLLPKIHEIFSRQIEHMARLLDDLLDASRISSGKITLQKRPVLFNNVIDRAIEVSQPLIDKRKQHLSVRLQSQPVLVDGDLVRLAQVFSNLLINAAKFTPELGAISLTAEVRPEGIVAVVEDTGIGIPPEMQPHVFELFMQGPRTLARTEGGLGIGLTIVRNLVEMHGGTISVKSEGAGQGSRFTVTLPVHGVLELQSAYAADEPAAEASCRILLVEDNADANATLRMLLELQGHAVESAFDGLSGLNMALNSEYDALICDIGLPELDGLELVTRLRANGSHAVRPMPLLIATSGYGQPEDRRRALVAGFDEYLLKPVDTAVLLRLLDANALLRGPEKSGQ
jgi:two-component system CheB/CheR fusion protein